MKELHFKEWLLLEDGDNTSNFFFGSILQPSDAFDFQYSFNDPGEFWYYKGRIKLDQKEGRKYHGMDTKVALNLPWVSIYSNTMPGTEEWKHRPDNRPNLHVDMNAKFFSAGIGTRVDDPLVLLKVNDLLDKTAELDKKFGKFTPKYYELPKDFDEPWIKPR